MGNTLRVPLQRSIGPFTTDGEDFEIVFPEFYTASEEALIVLAKFQSSTFLGVPVELEEIVERTSYGKRTIRPRLAEHKSNGIVKRNSEGYYIHPMKIREVAEMLDRIND